MNIKHLAHYEKLWNKVGDWKNLNKTFRNKTPSSSTLEFIEFLSKDKTKNRKVLDVGCGGGRNLIPFAQHGFDCYGIDFSKTAISLAKKLAEENRVSLNLKIGDVLKLTYKKEYFDVIIDDGCLHHLKKSEYKNYLKNIVKVLKKEGYFKLYCFSAKTKLFLGKKITEKYNWIYHNNHYTHFFTLEEIKELFKKNLKIIKILEEKDDKERYFWFFYMKKI